MITGMLARAAGPGTRRRCGRAGGGAKPDEVAAVDVLPVDGRHLRAIDEDVVPLLLSAAAMIGRPSLGIRILAHTCIPGGPGSMRRIFTADR